jgi:hypothetical protein
LLFFAKLNSFIHAKCLAFSINSKNIFDNNFSLPVRARRREGTGHRKNIWSLAESFTKDALTGKDPRAVSVHTITSIALYGSAAYVLTKAQENDPTE